MRLITIAHFDYPYQAHLSAALLEAEGIPCTVADEQMAGLAMFYSQSAGGVKLKVPESRAEEARAVLSDALPEAEGSEEEP